jgi:diguanylate cyclase (GGDEF)-like protein/PAS domain S-box-containing protein
MNQNQSFSDESFRRLDILSNVFNAISDMIFVMEADGDSFRYVLANEAACQAAGGGETIYGKRLEDVLSPEQVSSIKPKYQQAAETKSVVVYEDMIATPDGTIVCETILTPVCAENEPCRIIVAVVRDITERKKREQELQKMKQRLKASQERYRKLVEFLPEAIIVFNGEGKIIYVNIAAVKLLGAKQKKDIVGNWIWKFLYNQAQAPKKIRQHWQKALGVQAPFIEELLRLDGKIIYSEVLLSSIEYGGEPAIQGIFRDVTERINYERQLEFLAFHDPLTGLPNRRLFLDIVSQSIEEAKQTKKGLAVMYLDMDHFKDVNDTLGHDIGDQLLKRFAKRLKENIGANAVPCRIGGDEFLVLFKDIKKRADIEKLVRRLYKNIQEPYKIKEHEIKVTISIGIAVYPADGTTPKELLRRADQALYEAKIERNSYRFYIQ